MKVGSIVYHPQFRREGQCTGTGIIQEVEEGTSNVLVQWDNGVEEWYITEELALDKENGKSSEKSSTRLSTLSAGMIGPGLSNALELKMKDIEKELIALRCLYESVVSRINKLEDDTRAAIEFADISEDDKGTEMILEFCGNITELIGE